MVLARPNASAEDDARHLEWVKTRTAERIVSLYAKQLGLAQTGVDPDAPAVLAAMSMHTTGILPRRAVYIAVEDCRRQRGLSIEAGGIKKTIAGLKRTGIIRDVQIKPAAGGAVEGYAIGIPSIADHTQYTTQTESPHQWQKYVEQARLYLDIADGGDMGRLTGNATGHASRQQNNGIK